MPSRGHPLVQGCESRRVIVDAAHSTRAGLGRWPLPGGGNWPTPRNCIVNGAAFDIRQRNRLMAANCAASKYR
ncbi:MAG: hypothetical protein U0694_15805 [Anaerolineae bacterium]